MNNRLNSTLVENCLKSYLPDEYFIMSLSVMAVLTFFVFLLSVTTALLALRTRKSLFRKERTWITALDFIGGIGGVDSIFESYETFLGKNQEELRREHSDIRRRFSSPYIRREQLRRKQKSSGKRSNSNFETTRRRTLKEEEEDEANICIEILHNPSIIKNYQNLPQPTRRDSDGILNLMMRRLSVTSLSAEVVTPATPPTPTRSQSSSRPPSPAPTRKFIKNRSGSLEGLQSPVNRIKTLARKKHSVIHEVTE